jgi:anti-sigma regulatory factor (Ser/Thr protein kinase)
MRDGNDVITPVNEPSQVTQARRRTAAFAAAAGLPPPQVDGLGLVATELATNLLRHAGCGELLAAGFDDADGAGVELLSLDRGPGMRDVAACLQDGFSTAGSLGRGLGAIARQADQLRIYSRPGLGSVLSARFVMRPPPPGLAVQCGAAMMPHPGETACGDRWAWAPTAWGVTILLADGSGHGRAAEAAASAAEAVFRRDVWQAGTSGDLMARMREALLPTTGAALALAQIRTAARVVRFTGLGEVGATLIADGRITRIASAAGAWDACHAYAANPLVVLQSSGLAARWDMAHYPELAAQHPALLAGVLLRDFRRGREDASVVVVRALR